MHKPRILQKMWGQMLHIVDFKKHIFYNFTSFLLELLNFILWIRRGGSIFNKKNLSKGFNT